VPHYRDSRRDSFIKNKITQISNAVWLWRSGHRHYHFAPFTQITLAARVRSSLAAQLDVRELKQPEVQLEVTFPLNWKQTVSESEFVLSES
jgi:hypothetical protein